MYALERLILLSSSSEDSTLCRCARITLANIHRLTSMSSSEFSQAAGISKAGLHRFYSKGGFESFKNYTSTIYDEYLTLPQYSLQNPTGLGLVKDACLQLEDDLKACSKVVLYGSQRQIDLLYNFRTSLSFRKDVRIINDWDLETARMQLQSLGSKDIFIGVNIRMDLEYVFEHSMNEPSQLDYFKIEKLNCKKYYLGPCKSHHESFVPLLDRVGRNVSIADVLEEADLCFSGYLQERIRT